MFFNIKGAEEYGLTLRSIDDALTINKKITELVDSKENAVDKEKKEIVIVGGGATGVQLAGALADFVNKSRVYTCVKEYIMFLKVFRILIQYYINIAVIFG